MVPNKNTPCVLFNPRYQRPNWFPPVIILMEKPFMDQSVHGLKANE
jgi:hypothetical protein